jgi:hypothetical protein
MVVALQKHFEPLDTDFRGDRITKNKLFGERDQTIQTVFDTGKLVSTS